MSEVVVRAKFIGADGSMGYKKGKIYTLFMNRHNLRGYRQVGIVIRRIAGGGLYPYINKRIFEKDWKIIWTGDR